MQGYFRFTSDGIYYYNPLAKISIGNKISITNWPILVYFLVSFHKLNATREKHENYSQLFDL